MITQMLRFPKVKDRTGDPRSTFYLKIKQGLMTRQVPLGVRSVGWPEHEVEAINAARIAGKSQDEIRALVSKLHADRQKLYGAMSSVRSEDDAA